MNNYLSPAEIDTYIQTDSRFSDFQKFDADNKSRLASKTIFLSREEYAPNYDYPNLENLYDDSNGLLLKKHATYEAILELEANKNSGYLTPEIYELYASFHENRLKKIMLVQSAEKMLSAISSSAKQLAQQEFRMLNEQLYGTIDSHAFGGIMLTERNRTKLFEPNTALAASIKTDLTDYFEERTFSGSEKPFLDTTVISKLNTIIMKKHALPLSTFPDSDDSILYNAAQSKNILESAVKASELSKSGWKVEVSKNRSVPVTNVSERTVYLPLSLERTAEDLKRLYIHELGVHAERSQNGKQTEVKILSSGTAAYADAEEGLGVLLESVVSNSSDNQSFHRARDRYITAGLALGIDGTPRDAQATFRILWRLLAIRNAEDGIIGSDDTIAAKSAAYVHIENAFRGTSFTAPGVIYCKLKVYYEGLLKNARYFSDNQDDLQQAFTTAMIGKFDHTDPSETALVKRLLG